MDRYIGIDVRAASCTNAVVDNGALARWVDCRRQAFQFLAERHAEQLGLPRHAEVRRRFIQSIVDAERTLRLEAAGWQTTVVSFVAPTVTPTIYCGGPSACASQTAWPLRRISWDD
jgi:hypothetical protein